MPAGRWSELNSIQLGTYAEYYARMQMTRYGFQVFVPEIDDRGIDFVVRSGRGAFHEIQVKSIRGFNYVCMRSGLTQKFGDKTS